jgi:anti-sigma B factor antagonist
MSISINSKLDSNNKIWDINLEGELDVSTADKLKEYLNELLNEEIADMKLNLENLDYIDSTGLGVMIGILKKLKIENKEIYIVNPKNNVRKIFNITGLDKIFKMEG